MSSSDSASNKVPSLIWTTILPARLLINAQFRIPYPFLPAISRGLGVPLAVASLLLTARDLVGVSSPLYGYLADRFGRKTVMLGGLLALVAGASLVVAGGTFGVALVAFALLGLAKSSYDPAMQAFVSDAVPYERRGQALGITEFSWAGAWLLGVPLAGLLIARWDWRAPFLIIALLGLLGLLGTARLKIPLGFPSPIHPRSSVSATHLPGSAADYLRPLLTRRTLLVLAVSGLVILASENFFIIYGAWMEAQFGLAPTALGLTSVVVSVAELTAAILSAVIVDRLGKHRSLFLALAANAVAYLLLPVLAGSFGSALVGIVILAATSEFAIVSTLPLVSELVPRSRGTVMAVNAALTALAATAASLIAPRLWGVGGLGWVTSASAADTVLAALLLWFASTAARTQQEPLVLPPTG
jgi:predicted MFS family arabinose efflux permease